jgi:RNA polymerase-binding transcription factor DksA
MTKQVKSSNYKELEKTFEEEILSVKQRIKENLQSLDYVDINPTDHLDKAQSNQELLDINQTDYVLSKRLNTLSIALNKLKNNLDYGDCSSCGFDIPKERLQAIPESTQCFECLSAKENENARYMI